MKVYEAKLHNTYYFLAVDVAEVHIFKKGIIYTYGGTRLADGPLLKCGLEKICSHFAQLPGKL